MCGIIGIFSRSQQPIPKDISQELCSTLTHRGPNHIGSFQTPQLFLGHTRLSVIDLHPQSHQPFCNADKSLVLAYNGEIYNYRELKSELTTLGHSFATTSDTEVLLTAYKVWGLDAICKLNGMFAFCLWDDRNQTLHIVRDRYGTKPLYVATTKDFVIFSSEIKAILATKLIKKELNTKALEQYFTFQNLLDDSTLFEGIHMLEPATVLSCSASQGLRKQRFWDFDFSHTDTSLSFEQASEHTRHLLQQAVARQLVSDVPIGSYLSGGMDSGSITALAAGSQKHWTTFTAGFELSTVTGIEATFDERRDAELMANAFKTEHYEQVIHAGDLASVLPKLIWHLEDLRLGMCYSNYYIARLASKFVTVCLSGTGGDELFGGYPWRYYRVVHSLNREDYFQNYYRFWQRLTTDDERQKLLGTQYYSPYETFLGVFNQNPHLKFDTATDHVANSLYFECKTFLQSLLTVGDKLSMAHSLEERFPFLDNDLVDFAQKIPVTHKLKNLENTLRIDENEVKRNLKYRQKYNDGKNVLREGLKVLLPDTVTKRPKQGFSSPDESWFRGENFAYVKDMLLQPNTQSEKYLNKDFIKNTINEHAKGKNHRLLIWSFLCFEEWCRQFM